MKSFSTYLELKEKWTISQFIESLFQVYGIEYQDIDYNQKRIENHCYDIYQYPHDGSVVVHLYHRMEYIYNEKEGGLCIHNDGYQKGYRYIDELLSNHLIKDKEISLSNQPIKICHENKQQVIQWLDGGTQLPILYIRYEKIVDPFYLAQQLRGIAYVFYEDNQEVGHWMAKHCQKILTNNRVIIYYLNGDYKTYRFAKKESQDQLQQRILHQLTLYLKQRQYGNAYSFRYLEKNYLDNLRQFAQDYEKQTIDQLGEEIDKLEEEKEKYCALISGLESELNVLQMQNEILEEELSFQDNYTLLDKGDIPEYYQAEQKDILLDMLEDDVKKNHVEKEDLCLLKDILNQNPKDGTRDMYLEKILRTLISSYDFNKLKKYGIFMKGDKSKHYLVMFFDNSRYQSTLASTPSDQNACRQVYRQFRKYFF